MNGFGVEVVAAASADSIFDLDLPGPVGFKHGGVVLCYMSSSRLPLLGFLLFPLPFSRAAVSPIIFSIVGIGDALFPSSPVCNDPFPLPPPPSAIYPRPMPPVSSAAVTVPHPGCSALLPTWLSTRFTDEWAVLGEGPLSVLRGPPQPPPGGWT